MFKKGWKEAEHENCWRMMQKGIDLEDQTPLLDQAYLECPQREAKVDLQAVQYKGKLFKKSTTTREAHEKDQTTEKYSLEKITALKL